MELELRNPDSQTPYGTEVHLPVLLSDNNGCPFPIVPILGRDHIRLKPESLSRRNPGPQKNFHNPPQELFAKDHSHADWFGYIQNHNLDGTVNVKLARGDVVRAPLTSITSFVIPVRAGDADFNDMESDEFDGGYDDEDCDGDWYDEPHMQDDAHPHAQFLNFLATYGMGGSGGSSVPPFMGMPATFGPPLPMQAPPLFTPMPPQLFTPVPREESLALLNDSFDGMPALEDPEHPRDTIPNLDAPSIPALENPSRLGINDPMNHTVVDPSMPRLEGEDEEDDDPMMLGLEEDTHPLASLVNWMRVHVDPTPPLEDPNHESEDDLPPLEDPFEVRAGTQSAMRLPEVPNPAKKEKTVPNDKQSKDDRNESQSKNVTNESQSAKRSEMPVELIVAPVQTKPAVSDVGFAKRSFHPSAPRTPIPMKEEDLGCSADQMDIDAVSDIAGPSTQSTESPSPKRKKTRSVRSLRNPKPAIKKENQDEIWKGFEVLESAPSDHHFLKPTSGAPMGKSFLARLRKEHKVLSSSLPGTHPEVTLHSVS
jgi:hypothetical protein